MPKQPARNELIKLIHTGRRALYLDDATYRDMLESITGLRSCADKKMTDKKLMVVVSHMRDRGFTPRQARPADLSTPQQRALAQALWDRMYAFAIVRDGSNEALNSYCRRMAGCHLGACTAAQCQLLIECLKLWWRRAANPAHVAMLEAMIAPGEEDVVQ